MGEMSIPAALKRKNRLVKRLAQAINRMHESNVYETGDTPEYNSTELLQEIRALANELAALKAAIQESNAKEGNFKDIMKLAELKGVLKSLDNLNCKGGKTRNRFRMDDTEPAVIESVAQITGSARDKAIDEIQAEVDEIEDRLSQKNSATKIEFDFKQVEDRLSQKNSAAKK